MKLRRSIRIRYLLQFLRLDLAVLQRVPYIRHLVDNEDHLSCLIRIDQQSAKVLPDEVIKQFLCNDIDEHIRVGNRTIGNLIVVRPQRRMNPRGIDHSDSMPVIVIRLLRRDPHADSNVFNSCERFDYGGLARTVLPCKDDADRLIL